MHSGLHSCVQGAVIQPLTIATAEMLPEDELAVETVKFWKRDRDLGALLFYVRRAGPPSIDYLISPSKFNTSIDRVWAEGAKCHLLFPHFCCNYAKLSLATSNMPPVDKTLQYIMLHKQEQKQKLLSS